MSIKVSEIFRSIQGEGDMTGRLSIWIRFFGCNLRCGGFYQVDPTNPKTYQKTIVDWTKVQKMTDLPVFEFGCDSEYSWHPEYKKLVTNYKNADALVEDLKPFLYDGSKWQHPITENTIDLCFTGGEPMLQQKAMVDIMKELNCDDKELVVQIETNGTKKIDQVLIDYCKMTSHEIHFNISPKLFLVSGEKGKVNHENILAYQELTTSGILKFVINNSDEAWQDLNLHVKVLRDMGVWLPVYIMPCGSTREQQSDVPYIKAISERAIQEGYHVSGRLHTILFGNGMGT